MFKLLFVLMLGVATGGVPAEFFTFPANLPALPHLFLELLRQPLRRSLHRLLPHLPYLFDQPRLRHVRQSQFPASVFHYPLQ